MIFPFCANCKGSASHANACDARAWQDNPFFVVMIAHAWQLGLTSYSKVVLEVGVGCVEGNFPNLDSRLLEVPQAFFRGRGGGDPLAFWYRRVKTLSSVS